MALIQLRLINLGQLFLAPAQEREAMFQTAIRLRKIYEQMPGVGAILAQRVLVDDETWKLSYHPEPGDLEIIIGAVLPEVGDG